MLRNSCNDIRFQCVKLRHLKLQHSIVQYSLKLTLSCLSYDFIGTCGGEEVSDDMMSVQVPTNWRQAFLSPSDTPDPVPLFFRLFENLPANLGHHVSSYSFW